MKKIIIVGSGGFAKHVAFLIDEINRKNYEWDFLGYVDKNSEIGTFNGKYRVFQHDDWIKNVDFELYAVVGIGDPRIVKNIVKNISVNPNIKFPNLIHPNVIGDWDRISIKQGNIICAGNLFSTDTEIGSFNIFNRGCTIGHDAIFGDYNIINPGSNISGGIRMEGETMVGTGAQVLQYLTIVPEVVIGAGALVVNNINEKGVYIGVPARKIK